MWVLKDVDYRRALVWKSKRCGLSVDVQSSVGVVGDDLHMFGIVAQLCNDNWAIPKGQGHLSLDSLEQPLRNGIQQLVGLGLVKHLDINAIRLTYEAVAFLQISELLEGGNSLAKEVNLEHLIESSSYALLGLLLDRGWTSEEAKDQRETTPYKVGPDAPSNQPMHLYVKVGAKEINKYDLHVSVKLWEHDFIKQLVGGGIVEVCHLMGAEAYKSMLEAKPMNRASLFHLGVGASSSMLSSHPTHTSGGGGGAKAGGPTRVRQQALSNPESLHWGAIAITHSRRNNVDAWEVVCCSKSHCHGTTAGQIRRCRRVIKWGSGTERDAALHLAKAWAVAGMAVEVNTQRMHYQVFDRVLRLSLLCVLFVFDVFCFIQKNKQTQTTTQQQHHKHETQHR